MRCGGARCVAAIAIGPASAVRKSSSAKSERRRGEASVGPA